MNCPACRSKTVEQGFEGSRGARVPLDVCLTCHGLWFDAKESIQLSSNGVLRLFRQMHGRRDGHYRLKEPLACPAAGRRWRRHRIWPADVGIDFFFDIAGGIGDLF